MRKSGLNYWFTFRPKDSSGILVVRRKSAKFKLVTAPLKPFLAFCISALLPVNESDDLNLTTSHKCLVVHAVTRMFVATTEGIG